MLKKTLSLIILAGILGISCGCSSVDTGRDFNNQQLSVDPSEAIEHINVKIWGIYFFTTPVFTGSTKYQGRIAVFKDTVNVKHAVQLLTKRSSDIGASKTIDLQTDVTETWLPYTLVLWMKEVKASGNAIK